MDIHYEHNEILFVWDEEKAQKNRIRHKGIIFEKAVESFFDPFLVFVDASRHSEQRNGIIGKTASNQLLFVVHIQLDDDRIRIISARQATSYEKREYYEHQHP